MIAPPLSLLHPDVVDRDSASVPVTLADVQDLYLHGAVPEREAESWTRWLANALCLPVRERTPYDRAVLDTLSRLLSVTNAPVAGVDAHALADSQIGRALDDFEADGFDPRAWAPGLPPYGGAAA